MLVTPTTLSTTRKPQHYRHEFVFIPLRTLSIFLSLYCLFLFVFGRLILKNEDNPVNGGEGDYDDFQSAFICLPAVPRKYEHANEHFPRLRHMNLHVIVVVAGSGPNTGQVSKMGEMAKQRLTQRRLIWIFFFFFWLLHCVARAVNQLRKWAWITLYLLSDSVIAQAWVSLKYSVVLKH